MSAAEARKLSVAADAGARAANGAAASATMIPESRNPARAANQTSNVWSFRLKKIATMINPARPYAPSTSPNQSSAAWTAPKINNQRLRFCSRRRAALAGRPDATWRV